MFKIELGLLEIYVAGDMGKHFLPSERQPKNKKHFSKFIVRMSIYFNLFSII
jgi:hypothetical protein